MIESAGKGTKMLTPMIEPGSSVCNPFLDAQIDGIKHGLSQVLLLLRLCDFDKCLALVGKIFGRTSWAQARRDRSAIHPTTGTMAVFGASTKCRTDWKGQSTHDRKGLSREELIDMSKFSNLVPSLFIHPLYHRLKSSEGNAIVEVRHVHNCP